MARRCPYRVVLGVVQRRGTVGQSPPSLIPLTDLLDVTVDPRRPDRGAQRMPRMRNPPRWVPAAPNDPLCRSTPHPGRHRPAPSAPPSHPGRRSHAEARASPATAPAGWG